ncbi:MAG: hypothetical protein HYT22_02095 [Candidatus Niyogibacteria bacterium]|nr:hypothetical protein [Candidatus Niyogibacteria bacterium]
MAIEIIREPITRNQLRQIAEQQFGDFVKAVVDSEHEIMAIGGELHADEEVLLSEEAESKRECTWGINLYPDNAGEEWIEFDSMVNIKPQYGNRSRNVENPEIREKIKTIVKKLIRDE